MKGEKTGRDSDDESEPGLQDEAAVERLTDLIMFAQRSFVLDLSKELSRHNISYAQFFFLGYLANEDFLTLTEIATKLGHSTAAAAGLVDRLERLGYVQSLRPAENRGQMAARITREGIDLVGHLRSAIAEGISKYTKFDDLGSGAPYLNPLPDFQGSSDQGGTESHLIEAINSGFSKEFWERFRELKDKAEDAELSWDEVREMAEMADRIEGADAERLAAVAELAQLRREPFEKVLAEFEIETAIH